MQNAASVREVPAHKSWRLESPGAGAGGGWAFQEQRPDSSTCHTVGLGSKS